MHHLAIMKKSRGLLPKILSGQKTIESRRYTTKYAPRDKIHPGDTVYFKNSGEPVTLKADVTKVLQFSDLTPHKVHDILNQYGQKDGLGIDDIPIYYDLFKNKKYCILVFLQNPQQIPPFTVNKTGFGAMASWIYVDDISKIINKRLG